MPQEPDRVLVTGANGALGRRLLPALAGVGGGASPMRVRAVVRSERAAATVRALGLPPERVEVVVLDYHDGAAVEKAATGCASAFHLVGILKESSRARYEDAHEGTCTVLAGAAARAGLGRIVYPSILGADPASANACLRSKGRAERILLESGVPATVLRLPMVLGGDDPATRALRARARARVVPLPGGGRTLEQPIDVEDVVAACRAALDARPGEALALDLAGPESLPHRELVRRAAGLLGRRPLIVPVPVALVWALAALLERMSDDPPVTRPMLGVLLHDDQIDPAPACAALGISLTPLEATLRRCVLGGEGSA